MLHLVETISHAYNRAIPLFDLLTRKAGQAIETCGEGLELYTIQAGDWITGLARTIAERLGLDISVVINNINKSNGWASAPDNLDIGQGVCLYPEYITAIQNAPQPATCPPGFPNCFTEGINTIQTTGVSSVDIPTGDIILGGAIGLLLISGIVWSIRHRTQRE